MKSKEIVNQLKDDAKYYGEFGRKYLSNSDISALLNNPLPGKADQINLESAPFCQPGLCLEGPAKSTRDPHFLATVARALLGRAHRINLESTPFC